MVLLYWAIKSARPQFHIKAHADSPGPYGLFYCLKGGDSMEKTTISVQELSAQMGISLPKAYELVKSNGFPTIRIGTRILIPVDAYKEWLMKTASKSKKG